MYVNIFIRILLCYRVNFLDVVLPATVDLLESNRNNEVAIDVEVGEEDLMNTDPLAAAADAAICNISGVATASKDRSFTPANSLGSTVSKSSLDEILLVSSVADSKCASTYPVDSAVSDSDANSSAKLSTDDLTIFKQGASTSSDKNGSPSNMVLACTGSNSEDSCLDRFAIFMLKVFMFVLVHFKSYMHA